jgi:hypothetical protein
LLEEPDLAAQVAMPAGMGLSTFSRKPFVTLRSGNTITTDRFDIVTGAYQQEILREGSRSNGTHQETFAVRKTLSLGLLALTTVAASPESAPSQVIVSTPRVQLTVGGPVGFAIDSPRVSFRVGRPLGVPMIEPVPPPPPLEVVPPVAVPLPPPIIEPRPPTPVEFASVFKPLPGRHEVVLLHPYTNTPVTVCFDLPPGYPRRVVARKRFVEFDYGRDVVEVVFFRDGSYKVRY